jgi:exopolyphosphatase / guanosine-5'-triphosphate,3'-diphosphate pyrophosphatase
MAAAAPRKTTNQPNPHVEPAGRDSLRIAAIDVGSNSVHMIVAQVDADGGFTTLWRMKEMVGLGRISFPSRKLSGEAIDRAINTLGRFKQAALQRQCEKIVTVATSAVREATNGGDFIERARRDLKLYIKVVSAREEARLIYLGVRHATPLGKKPHLLIDIGGGSVELIVGNEQQPLLLESRKLGAARMTAQFCKSDPLSKADRLLMLGHYENELADVIRNVKKHQPDTVLGTSGTLENIASMCGSETDAGGNTIINRKRFDKVYRQIVKTNAAERETIGGLDDQRKEQIVAAVVLVHFLFEHIQMKQIRLVSAALREGIVMDYVGRHVPDLQVRRDIPDPRRRAVFDVARRYNFHERHSLQVARLTLRLFDELRGLHDLNDPERELIEYAALLHDIGWHISPEGHHKHSMYLIENSGLHEFMSEEEVGIIACIARYHRKKLPTLEHDKYAALSRIGRRVVDVGAALLRVADGLDRSHQSVVNDLKCKVGAKVVTVTMSVRADAELEIWGASRKSELFEKSLSRSLELVTK